MNIIQSYFNKNISISDINYTGGYLSPIVNWLSMAYSCLLLRRHNPYDRLIFYGDTDIIYLFEHVFELPYDEYHSVHCNGNYSDWFYCWPKIITYMAQNDAFIHVDNDVFMWTPIPPKLRKAQLVAQHMEKDSQFYIDVYRQINKDGVIIPDYIKTCFSGKYVNSFNAGLLGGNDILFFKEYTLEIQKFLDTNVPKILASDKKFLYNVVFEQWLFFGMTKKFKKNVTTFYERPIIDFNMREAHVPSQILSLEDLEYMHVMEHKDNIRCNRFITYKMQSDFPKEYEKIISACWKLGLKSSLNACYLDSNSENPEIFYRSHKLKELFNLTNESLSELKLYEDDKKNKQRRYAQQHAYYLELQKAHNLLIDMYRKDKKTLARYSLTLNPYLIIMENVSPSLIDLLVYKTKKPLLSDPIILQLYNPTFNKIDEFIWSKKKYSLLKSIVYQSNAMEIILNENKNSQLNQVSLFVKQCLFDGIITFRV